MTDITDVMKACDFAAKAHKDQRRKNKNKTPYINHPIDVANLVAQAIGSEIQETFLRKEAIMAGLLHDTIEDVGVTYAEIETEFGKIVADLVQECTDDKKLDKVTRKQLQIQHAKVISLQASWVKLADKYSNLENILEDPPAKWTKQEREGYIVWCYAVVQELLKAHPNEKFQDKFNVLFEKFGNFDPRGLTSVQLTNELNLYYAHLDEKESKN